MTNELNYYKIYYYHLPLKGHCTLPVMADGSERKEDEEEFIELRAVKTFPRWNSLFDTVQSLVIARLPKAQAQKILDRIEEDSNPWMERSTEPPFNESHGKVMHTKNVDDQIRKVLTEYDLVALTSVSKLFTSAYPLWEVDCGEVDCGEGTTFELVLV